MQSDWKFYITKAAAGRVNYVFEVFPKNFNNCNFITEKESEQIFYRKKLNGKLTFINDEANNIYDFNTFLNIDTGADSYGRCCDLYLEIKHLNNGVFESYWTGLFATNDGEFDLDRCEFSVNPKTYDKYTCLLDNYGKQYNILNTSNEIVTNSYENVLLEYTYCEYYLLHYNKDLDAPGCIGIYCYTDGNGNYVYNTGEPPATSINANHCNLDFNDAWLLSDVQWYWYDSFYYKVKEKYVRQYEYTTSQAVPPLGNGWVYIGQQGFLYKWARQFTEWCNTSQWVWSGCGSNSNNKLFCERDLPSCYSVITYSHNRLITDTINYLLHPTEPGAYSCINLLTSHFLTDAINPVTGETSKTNILTIAQKSDIVNPTASQSATLGMLSLKELLEILKNMFQLYWDIETAPNGQPNLRVEHISHWTKGQGLDLTSPTYFQYIKSKNKYNYNKNDLAKYEIIKWMEASSIDFVGLPITYYSSCVNHDETNNTKEYQITNVTTDLLLIQDVNAPVSSDGFVILANKNVGGVYRVIDEIGELSNVYCSNGHLSTANLFKNYWIYNRNLESGLMNNVQTDFIKTKKTKEQTELEIPLCNYDLDFNKLIKTELGWGEIRSLQYNPKTEISTINLIY